MCRWYGYSVDAVRAMLMTDFWILDGFLKRTPPADILLAGYLHAHGFKVAEEKRESKSSLRQIARANADSLSALPPQRLKTIDQLPGFLRTPEKLLSIEKMRSEWAAR